MDSVLIKHKSTREAQIHFNIIKEPLYS